MTDAASSDAVVIKIGGSLLAEPGMVGRVGEWLDAGRLAGQTRVLIAGGGQAVDALRRIDAANPLPTEAAHWAAVDVMDTNARLLAHWLDGVRATQEAHAGSGDWALAPGRLLRENEPDWPGERLTAGWQTTSDAIAARIAGRLNAPLVILKHTLERAYESAGAAAEAGVIDPETPRLAAGLASFRLLGVVSPGLGLG